MSHVEDTENLEEVSEEARFLESFTVDKFCRFCLASKSDIQQHEICSGFLKLRDRDSHEQQVQEVRKDPELSKTYGVKRACPLTENLEHFHVSTGYPPDILHDILEGIVPGLTGFAQIAQILAANSEIQFVCHRMTTWYCEHLRSYQLLYSDTPSMYVVKLSELNEVLPLSAYRVYCEFTRVVGKNFRDSFFGALDYIAPKLIDLFRKKKGLTSQLLAELLRQTKGKKKMANLETKGELRIRRMESGDEGLTVILRSEVDMTLQLGRYWLERKRE
ncbi:hypothetical protein MHYP_G00150950 [Metynnis hypsauchen]